MKLEGQFLTLSMVVVFFVQILLRLDPAITNGNFSIFTLISFITLSLRGIKGFEIPQKIGVVIILQMVIISLHLFIFFVLTIGVYIIVQRHHTNEMVRFCAWTKKVEMHGKWIPVDNYLEKMGFKVTHGIAPEAKDKIIAKLNAINKDS